MIERPLHILILEPYYGGSHAAFVDTFVQCSHHDTTLLTLPARKWKWRMRGAAIWFAEQLEAVEPTSPFDLILCCDMLSVADLRALMPERLRRLPVICYFHENQLTYPIPADQHRDYQYAMTNITSCLAADAVWFNSQFHLNDFLVAAESLLRKMPDFVRPSLVEDIRSKSSVFYPPVRVERETPSPRARSDRPVILWPHRWEYDKNPEPFFDALLHLHKKGIDFGLILLGEQFRTAPEVFARSYASLADRILHTGFLASRSDYMDMLAKSDIVVSTAIQENFGIGVIEAIMTGCQPLLPARLAYSEIIPEKFHDVCLYEKDQDLAKCLGEVIAGRSLLATDRMAELRVGVHDRFEARSAVKRMDDAIGRFCATHR